MCMATAMLELRDRLIELEDRWGTSLDFRLAIDIGTVMASTVGTDPPSRNLWGGSIGIAKVLAGTTARRTIAASETAYDAVEPVPVPPAAATPARDRKHAHLRDGWAAYDSPRQRYNPRPWPRRPWPPSAPPPSRVPASLLLFVSLPPPWRSSLGREAWRGPVWTSQAVLHEVAVRSLPTTVVTAGWGLRPGERRRCTDGARRHDRPGRAGDRHLLIRSWCPSWSA